MLILISQDVNGKIIIAGNCPENILTEGKTFFYTLAIAAFNYFDSKTKTKVVVFHADVMETTAFRNWKSFK